MSERLLGHGDLVIVQNLLLISLLVCGPIVIILSASLIRKPRDKFQRISGFVVLALGCVSTVVSVLLADQIWN